QITNRIPASSLKRRRFDIPQNIKLVDPQFHVSSEVDLLVGAEVFWDLLSVGQIKTLHNHPTLQKTRLGWILAGRLGAPVHSTLKLQSFHASISNDQLHDQLSRFWQLEDNLTTAANYTFEETYCEKHFLSHVSQNHDGRYIVSLPIRENVINKLGDSRGIALKRLKGIERRFKRDPALKIQYTQFIDQYLSLGHMRLITSQPVL
ncbi:PREDICTED: uncharacterized protein LOC105461841, partial [Wasmannia auropunctata]|uniref:uncharacterized protein LOC105461841 n=1 Tax=Wasmannia auropunctata TaxID=64793 RepID=UPI0005F05675